MDSENSSCSFDKVEKVLLYCLAGKHIKSSWHSFEMNMFFSSNTPRILFLEFLDDKKNHPDRQSSKFFRSKISNFWKKLEDIPNLYSTFILCESSYRQGIISKISRKTKFHLLRNTRNSHGSNFRSAKATDSTQVKNSIDSFNSLFPLLQHSFLLCRFSLHPSSSLSPSLSPLRALSIVTYLIFPPISSHLLPSYIARIIVFSIVLELPFFPRF